MTIQTTLLAILLLLLLAGCGDHASAPSGSPESGRTVAASIPGPQIFEQRCAACHGANGTAGINGATNLRTSGLDSAAAFKVVSSGRGAMPAFGKMLSAAEIQELIGYLNSLKR